MTEKEFWEDDPQLYWAYHIFFTRQQKRKQEEEQYKAWLQGNLAYIAYSCALRDGFGKDSTNKGFPKYEVIFASTSQINDDRTISQKREEQLLAQNQFWARR